jgi:hypothetical protein
MALLAPEEVAPGQPSRLTRATTHVMTGPVVVAAAAAAAITCIALRDPNEPGAYPLCPFRALTGWDCPGCGSMRALHALTRADLRTAIDQNLLLVLVLPFLIWRWIAWTRRSWIKRTTGQEVPRRLAAAPVLYAFIGVVLLFWVVRNLPGVPFLGSGIG